MASTSFFFSAAQYSASDGSLSKSGLYSFAAYFERGTGNILDEVIAEDEKLIHDLETERLQMTITAGNY